MSRVIFWPTIDDARSALSLPANERGLDLGQEQGANKLVLGSLEENQKLEGLERIDSWPPELECLHLWNAPDLVELPAAWPAGLQILDVRRCPKLRSVPVLPSSLELLDLGGCTSLQSLPLPRSPLSSLEKLFLDGCDGLSETDFIGILEAAGSLHEFDFSGCAPIREIGTLSPQLFRIRLRNCTTFTRFACALPARLQTLDLNGAAGLKELPAALPPILSYLDLRGCSSLETFPEPAEIPPDYLEGLFTLYLAGSGLRNPPRSLHGTESENRADQVRHYFQGLRKYGVTEASRCKLLLLGNGYAGKTTLSKLLVYRESLANGTPVDRFRPDADEPSTHGIRFFDLHARLSVGGVLQPTSIHVWDFGGQDLYRNAHRIFVGAGSIFLLVWNPDEKPPVPSSCGGDLYEDVHRPNTYWIDFVRDARKDARLGIVCTRRGVLENRPPNETHPDRWRDGLRPDQILDHQGKDLRFFHVDSLGDGGKGTGECDGLERWIKDSAAAVLGEERGRIPRSYGVAQTMVEEWLRENTIAESTHRQPPHKTVPFDRFRDLLQVRWRKVLAEETSGSEVPDSVRTEEFSEPDVESCLEYLSNTGLLFWRKELPERNIVIGQKWALDGIYELLRRPTDKQANPVYEALKGAGGRFHREDLAGWSWDAMGYSREEQELLIGMMKACGLCFRTVGSGESWYRHDVYVSVTHLPNMVGAGLLSSWNHYPGEEHWLKLQSRWLHSGVWQQLMIREGEAAGRWDATRWRPSDPARPMVGR